MTLVSGPAARRDRSWRLSLALGGSPAVVEEPQSLPAGRRPTVSVVVPCYNYGSFLQRCVSHALDQPGLDVEVIVVDDASPDGSAAVAEAIAAADARVKVVRHATNRGHIATYNHGLSLASGEYVALVSADDLLTPGSVSRAVGLMEHHPTVGFVYGRAQHFRGQPPTPPRRTERWVRWSGADWLEDRCRAGHNVIASPEVVMRADLLRRLGGYLSDLPHSGDLEMWLRASTVADVGYVAGPWQALYRQHDANMHRTVFAVTDPTGQLVDLEHRWLAFSAVLRSGAVADAERLEALVRSRLAAEALWKASHAYERGMGTFPVDAFVEFATSLDPTWRYTRIGRRLLHRRALGMTRLPVHPVWAGSLVLGKMRRLAQQWRLQIAGV